MTLGACGGLTLATALFGSVACSSDALSGIGEDLGTGGGAAIVEESVRDILVALFPDLTDEELDALSASMSVEAVLDLKLEIDAMRALAAELGRALFTTAEERVEERAADLADANDGFPTSLAPISAAAFQDQTGAQAYIELAGVMSDRQPVLLAEGDVTVAVDGRSTEHELTCFHHGAPVDLVFLVDVTGSMSPVIGSVRRSLRAFVDAIVESNVTGTIGVVTFQDSVGVNISFQELTSDVERSPFFPPVAIDDPAGIEALQRFIARLEADSGMDAPENLAGAIDFANAGAIGYSAPGAANVIGEGSDDPVGTEPWPPLGSERRVFVAFTDSTFHSDSRTPQNSSLATGFKPRSIADITSNLRETGTVVHVVDPSWIDDSVDSSEAGPKVDADYWALATGGVGEDRIRGYSLTDLELVVVAENTGLLDIALQSIIASSCRVTLPNANLSASSVVSLELRQDTESVTLELVPNVF